MQNQTIKYMFLSLCCLVLGLFQSCSDITDTQREFLDRGEKIYAGKLDSLRVRGGLGRVQIEGLTHYARSTVSCIVTWKDNEKEFLMNEITQNDTAKIVLSDLKEGAYYFYVQTIDKEGNKSLRVECSGNSYGEEYKLTQTKKRISLMKPEPSKIVLHWNDSETAVKVDLKYENTANGTTELTLPGDVTVTELSDWKLGGALEIKTYTIPEKNALDMIVLDPVTQTFPAIVEYEVKKSNFKMVSLPTDIKGNGYGGVPAGMWDGIKGSAESSRYHSADGEGVPHHLTFDMGAYANLIRFEIVGRGDYVGWNPKRFQLWGIDSLEGAQTTLPSSDPGWEAEAKSKGWVLLSEETNKDEVSNTHLIKQGADKKVRYIRYRVLDVFGTGAGTSGTGVYGCVQELTFWADSLIPIE